MARSKPDIVPINSEHDFSHLINNDSLEKLIIVDVHQDWCGPTQAIMPFYNQIWIEIDDPEKRISLTSVPSSLPNVARNIHGLFPDLKLNNQGCRPLFLLFRDGHGIEAIDGLNTPHLKFLIDLYLPPLAKAEVC